ncbi:MAG TPA: isocitrate lyase/PEP mutase family protein [Pseudonocardia sp.]|jgi:2-methylisocitrate lyase-like PEP mutase family enzyme
MTAPTTSTAPHQARAALRQRLSAGELIVAPGVFDGISASLVARMDFAAAYLTGAGVAAAGFGLPDIGLLTQTEMAERARMITRVLADVPLIADADTGYGAALNVVRTVREYEAAGVAAIQLEDQAFPKRCGHLPDKELISADEFVVKLRAALDARIDPDLLLIARTDARGPLGLDAAIERANIYAAAGADVIFVEAPQDVAEIERIASEVKAPLLINLVHGGLTPIESTQRLAELGYAIAIHPTLPLGAAALAMITALTDLSGQNPTPWIPTTPADFFNLVGLAEWSALAAPRSECLESGFPDVQRPRIHFHGARDGARDGVADGARDGGRPGVRGEAGPAWA